MGEDSVSRRYAAALFAKALQKQELDAVEGNLTEIVSALKTVPTLRMLLQPLLTDARKKQMLHSAFANQIQPTTAHFLDLLVDKRRFETLPQVSKTFSEMVRNHRNIAFATAVSATPLTESQIVELKQTFETRTGKTIEMKTETDASLIGGVLVRIGDTVYDGTVKGSLNRLREQLLTRR